MKPNRLEVTPDCTGGQCTVARVIWACRAVAMPARRRQLRAQGLRSRMTGQGYEDLAVACGHMASTSLERPRERNESHRHSFAPKARRPATRQPPSSLRACSTCPASSVAGPLAPCSGCPDAPTRATRRSSPSQHHASISRWMPTRSATLAESSRNSQRPRRPRARANAEGTDPLALQTRGIAWLGRGTAPALVGARS